MEIIAETERDYDYIIINRFIPHQCCCGLFKLRTGSCCLGCIFLIGCMCVTFYYSMTLYLYKQANDDSLQFDMTYTIAMISIHVIGILVTLLMLYGLFCFKFHQAVPWLYFMIAYIVARLGGSLYILISGHRFLEFFRHIILGLLSLYCFTIVFAYFWKVKMEEDEDGELRIRPYGSVISKTRSDAERPAPSPKKRKDLEEVRSVETEVAQPAGWFSGWTGWFSGWTGWRKG